MKLFNKYQSRVLQFALELMARLEREDVMPQWEIQRIASRSGLDYADQVLVPLCRAGILEREGSGYRLSAGLCPPRLPAGQTERDYLREILELPEAELFFDDTILTKLAGALGENRAFANVQYYKPQGEPLPVHPGPEGFRTLLYAIRHRFLIRYTYRTRDDETARTGLTLPWKLEYSAYDRRWWIILYDSEVRRTIKARLDNLEHIQLAGPARESEADIRNAIERLLAPEPAVLQIRHTRGALERCFLVFENQQFEETGQVAKGCYRMSFRFYQFDRWEILKKLLYLGPAVRLLAPEDLREDLRKLLKSALTD